MAIHIPSFTAFLKKQILLIDLIHGFRFYASCLNRNLDSHGWSQNLALQGLILEVEVVLRIVSENSPSTVASEHIYMYYMREW